MSSTAPAPPVTPPTPPNRRSAALIATAVTLPLMVLIAVALVGFGGGTSTHGGSVTSGPLPAVTAAVPGHAKQQAANCTKLLEALPVSLGALNPRIVHTTPSTPFVVAWGQPAVVLSCGVARPTDLRPGSGVEFRTSGTAGSPSYDVSFADNANVWTTVDRAPYIAIRFPPGVQPANYLPTLSKAIAVLPAVCNPDGSEPDVSKLCTRRP